MKTINWQTRIWVTSPVDAKLGRSICKASVVVEQVHRSMVRPTCTDSEIEVDRHTCPVIGTVALTSTHIPESAVVLSKPRVRVVPPCPPWWAVCNRRMDVEWCHYNQYLLALSLNWYDADTVSSISKQEVVCPLSNVDIANDLEWSLPPQTTHFEQICCLCIVKTGEVSGWS